MGGRSPSSSLEIEGPTRTKGASFDIENFFVAHPNDTNLVVLVEVDGVIYALIGTGGRVRRLTVGPLDEALSECEFARFALRRAADGRSPLSDEVAALLQRSLLGPAQRLLPSGYMVIVPPPGSTTLLGRCYRSWQRSPSRWRPLYCLD